MKSFPQLTLFIACIFIVSPTCFTARILAYFPMPSFSHQSIITKMVNRLAERGHDVTYYAILRHKHLHPNVTFVYVDLPINFDGYDDSNDELYRARHYLTFTLCFWKEQLLTSEEILKSNAVQTLIHSNERYDLVIHESFIANEYAAALVHKFQAPGVTLLSVNDFSWANEMSGLPDNPSYVVDIRGELTDTMTFVERVQNLIQLVVTTGLNYYFLGGMQKLTDRYMNYTGWESRPPLVKLLADNALILRNSHHSIGYSYPTAPHTKEVGGINIGPVQPLPKDMEKFMDEATHGVIYFSFGSIIHPKHRFVRRARDHFISAFASLKQRVLWKFDDEVSGLVSKNVFISNWFPQNDVLAHRNIKLFITHGGQQSMVESIYHAVPMIVIPFIADQPKNANFVVKTGLGLTLDIQTLDNTTFIHTINSIIDNPRYKAEAQRRSNLLKDRPLAPLDEAVYWIEYVARHGRVLQPAAVHLSFMALHQLDVLTLVALTLAVCVFCIVKLVRVIKNSFAAKSNYEKSVTPDKKRK